MNFFKAIGRMFTIPRRVRAKLNANPLAPVVKGLLANELGAAINAAVSNNVKDSTAAAAISEALGHAVAGTGIFD